jgi:hypothetical protein
MWSRRVIHDALHAMRACVPEFLKALVATNQLDVVQVEASIGDL